MFLFAVNVCSFVAGFDSRQLINLFYLKDRAIASGYLLKNIILYTGVHIKLISEEALDGIIISAAREYGIDEDVLRSVAVRKNQFSISRDGKMGLTFISVEEFHKSDCKDPFMPDDNIRAAASAIKRNGNKNNVL